MKKLLFFLFLPLFCNGLRQDIKEKFAPQPSKVAGLCTKAFSSWGFKATECVDCSSKPNFVALYLNFPLPHPTIGLTWKRRDTDSRAVVMIMPNKNNKYNIFTILKHEVGHVLGLEHSTDMKDLMYPSTSNTEADNNPSDVDYLLAQSKNLGKEYYCEIRVLPVIE